MELYRGGRFGITIGDITRLEVDALVNSTNPGFDRGFGVDAAIHEAAGPELAKACDALGSAAFGQARVTPGFNLAARHVVHVVAPIWRDGTQGEEAQLAKTYRAALTAAMFNKIKTIAFPAISTGTYAYPFETATRIALETCSAFVNEHPTVFTQVIFCPFTVADGDIYKRLAQAILVD